MTASVRIQIFTIYKPVLDLTELEGSEHPSQQDRFGLDRPWPQRIQGEKPQIEQGNSINPSEARLKLSLPTTGPRQNRPELDCIPAPLDAGPAPAERGG